jgi:hypothetical protein
MLTTHPLLAPRSRKGRLGLLKPVTKLRYLLIYTVYLSTYDGQSVVDIVNILLAQGLRNCGSIPAKGKRVIPLKITSY